MKKVSYCLQNSITLWKCLQKFPNDILIAHTKEHHIILWFHWQTINKKIKVIDYHWTQHMEMSHAVTHAIFVIIESVFFWLGYLIPNSGVFCTEKIWGFWGSWKSYGGLIFCNYKQYLIGQNSWFWRKTKFMLILKLVSNTYDQKHDVSEASIARCSWNCCS